MWFLVWAIGMTLGIVFAQLAGESEDCSGSLAGCALSVSAFATVAWAGGHLTWLP